MRRLSANKKIILCVAGFVVVMAIIVGVLVMLGREETPEIPVDEGQVNLYEPGSVFYEEDTTAVEVTLSPAMQETVNANHTRLIESFISGHYYMSMIDYSSGTPVEMELALRGSNVQMATEMNGMKFDIMILNDNVYFVNSSEKKFIDFKSLMQMAGVSEDDFDLSEMREVTDMLNVSDYEYKGLDSEKTELDGYEATRYRLYSDDFDLYFWFVGDEMRQIDISAPGDASDIMKIRIKEFLPEVPSGMLTLIGLRRSTIFDFFGEEFMKSLY